MRAVSGTSKRDGLARLAAVLLACCLLAVSGAAPAGEAEAASPERRVALVIGNGAYRNTAALANPRNDAADMAAALERTGFDVIVALDATRADMDGALRAFADKLGTAEVALFYYAGHGLQVGNQNYLVPVEAKLARERDLEFEAMKLDFVLRQMEIDREGRTTIVMLDACRDNPLTRNLARSMGTRSAAVGQGLAPAATGVGTFIAYSTQPGNVALDGSGRNSPFTTALLANIAATGRNLNATMIEVRKSVIASTGGRQVPWDHSALTGDFYFVPGEARVGSSTPAPAARSDDVEALKARLKALEEAERQRAAGNAGRSPDAGAAANASSAGGGDIVRLAELKARLAVAEDKAKELQFKLLEARRTEGQARDPAERQRLLQASMRIQLDMTRAAQTARQLKDEIAGLAAPAPAAIAHPPAGPAGPATAENKAALAVDRSPSRTERGFDIYEQAALAGDKVKFGAADSVAGCINACHNTPGCVAGEYLAGVPAQRACSVYAQVRRLVGAGPGDAAFVKSGLGGRADLPPVQPKAPAAVLGDGFDLADNVRIEGTLAQSLRTPSPLACQQACAREAGCVGFQHGRKVPVMGQCHLFTAITARHEDRSWRSGTRNIGAPASR